MRSLLPLFFFAGFLATSAVIALPAISPPPQAAAGPAPSLNDNDAAAKHAKRTVCLKEAKARKLIGAQRDAFIKDCVAKS